MLLVVMIATAVAVGWYAQTRKARIGLVWGLLTLAAQVGVVAAVVVSVAGEQLYGTPAGDFATGAMGVGLGGGVMAVIVATLPKRR